MRCTRVNIYIQHLISNFRNIKKNCKDALICAAVKADGYGHGAVQTAAILEKEGCDYFGIASTLEAEELLNNGITTPLILLSLPVPEEIEYIVRSGIEPVVDSMKLIHLLEDEAAKNNVKVDLHLKVDTGMGRIGCLPSDVLKLAKSIEGSDYLNLKGFCTHLSTSELENQNYTDRQLRIFNNAVIELNNNGIHPEIIHCSNSGAMLMRNDSYFNMVRTGINLYGYPPNTAPKNSIDLKPVLELKSRVVAIKKLPKGKDISYGRTYTTTRESIIGTIPVGYADGYFRLLSNKTEVIINGKTFSQVGNICMDQMMVLLDDSVSLYDEVTLISVDTDGPNAETLAAKIGTISYEVLTNIHRVKRYYIK